MEEIKFSQSHDFPVLEETSIDNIYDGPYKFSTQTTAVYDDFILIDTGSEIYKIETVCDKAFYSDGRIAIIRGNTVFFYENFTFEKILELDSSNIENINDLVPDDIFNNQEENVQYFMIKKDVVRISPTEINYKENKIENTIHEDGANYFVAYADDVAIIGNDKSTEFLYFLNGKQIELEESDSISLRMNEEFDSVFARDVKFHDNFVMVIDDEKITCFKLNGFNKNNIKKTITCYKQEKNELVLCEDKSMKESAPKKENITSDLIDIGTGFESDIDKVLSSKPSIAESTQKTAKSGIFEPAKTDSNSLFSKNSSSSPLKSSFGSTFNKDLASLNKTVESKNEDKSIKPREASIFEKSQSSFNLSDLSIQKSSSQQVSQENEKSIFDFYSSEEPVSEKIVNKPDLKQQNINSFIKPKEDLSSQVNKTPTQKPEVKNTQSKPLNIKDSQEVLSKEDKNLAALEKDLKDKIEQLKFKFKNINNSSMKDFSEIKLIESNLNCDNLYNRIFNSDIKKYNQVLSSMITKLENKNNIDINNIKESIRYFNSRIMTYGIPKIPVRYSDPLAIRLSTSCSISNTVEDLISGIEIIKIKSIEGNANNRPKSTKNESKKPDLFSKSSQATFKPDNQNIFQNQNLTSNLKPKENVDNSITTNKNTNVSFSIPSNPSFIPRNENISTLSQPQFAAAFSTAPSVNQVQNIQSQPQQNNQVLFNQQNTSSGFAPSAPLFSTPQKQPQSIFGTSAVNNSMKVNDTTSLFNSLASSNSIVPNIVAPKDNNDSENQSAFSKFAGSRRMFK